MYIVRVTTKDPSEEVGVGYRNRTVRVEEVSLDKVPGIIVPVVVDLKGRTAAQIAAADKVIQNVVGSQAVEHDLVVEVCAQSVEIQHHVMDPVAVDRERVTVSRAETRDVEYAVRTMKHTSTCVDGRASIDVDVGPGFSAQGCV